MKVEHNLPLKRKKARTNITASFLRAGTGPVPNKASELAWRVGYTVASSSSRRSAAVISGNIKHSSSGTYTGKERDGTEGLLVRRDTVLLSHDVSYSRSRIDAQ